MGTSSRNSEVVHAGIYYPQGSRKARHCVRGAAQLLRLCAERGVAHRICGKLIVATSEDQHEALAGVAEHARGNGVELQHLSAAVARALEALAVVAMSALLALARAAGPWPAAPRARSLSAGRRREDALGLGRLEEGRSSHRAQRAAPPKTAAASKARHSLCEMKRLFKQQKLRPASVVQLIKELGECCGRGKQGK